MTYRECGFEEFLGPQVQNQTVIVGITRPFFIDFAFDQTPCSYYQTYNVRTINTETGLPILYPKQQGVELYLPPFMEYGTELDSFMWIDEPEWDDIGTYRVQVTCILEDKVFTEG